MSKYFKSQIYSGFRRARIFMILSVSLATFVTASAQDQNEEPPTPFTEIVLENFDRWDTDHTGTLDFAKLKVASLDDKNEGEVAAALAALFHWYQIAPKLPAIPKSFFKSYKPRRYEPIPPNIGPQNRTRIMEERLEAGPQLEAEYLRCRTVIRRGPYPVFSKEGPKWTDVRQGSIGDCGFIAPMGALVHRDPNEVRRIIEVHPLSYTIRFPDEVSFEMKALTDTQVGLLESDITNGLWPRILEIAYFQRPKVRVLNSSGQPTAVAASPFAALTSFDSKEMLLVNGYGKQVQVDKLQALASQVRERMKTAIANHKLIGLGSAHDGPMAFGLPGYHAYAVFGYDGATDMVTLWNPWGDDYRPRGPDEVERVHGVFKLPLVDMVRAFRIIGFETNDLYVHSVN